jgi:hypothetical protein
VPPRGKADVGQLRVPALLVFRLTALSRKTANISLPKLQPKTDG